MISNPEYPKPLYNEEPKCKFYHCSTIVEAKRLCNSLRNRGIVAVQFAQHGFYPEKSVMVPIY